VCLQPKRHKVSQRLRRRGISRPVYRGERAEGLEFAPGNLVVPHAVEWSAWDFSTKERLLFDARCSRWFSKKWHARHRP
jgi:hypothetical protein